MSVVFQKFSLTCDCQHHGFSRAAAGSCGTTRTRQTWAMIGDVRTKAFCISARAMSFTFNVDDVRIPYGEHTLKYPAHPQAETSQYGKAANKDRIWHPHPRGAKPKDVLEIPTTCNGMHEKTPHPTQKPEELLRKIVLASSCPGDVVIDPFLGSGTTAVVAEQLKRQWKGCDLSAEFCQLCGGSNRISRRLAGRKVVALR